MAYTTTDLASSLKNYVDANKMQLLVDSVATSDDTSFMSLMPDTRTSAPVVILDLDANLADGTNCGFQGGNTDISSRIVTVKPIKAQYEWCEKDLLNTALASEFSKDEKAFEEKLTQMIVEKNSKALNALIWEGNTSNSDLIDGIMTIVANESSITPISNSRTNYMDRIKDIYLAIRPELMDETEVYCSPVAFRTLVMELNDAKLINYNLGINDNAKSFVYPGTNLKINMIQGMGSDTKMIATVPSNLVLATAFDDDELRLWYSADNETFRATWMVMAGTQIAFPDRVVYDVD